MMDQGFAKCRQKIEVCIRGVGLTRQQTGTDAVVAVAFAQQLADHLGRTVGLVLVDEGRGLVGVGRIAVRIRTGGEAAGQVGWIVRAGADSDLWQRVVLGQEVQAVIDVLSEGHEEDVGAGGILGEVCLLRAEDVGDRARIKAGVDRVDRVVGAVACVRETDEGLVGRTQVGVGDVVARAFQIADAGGSIIGDVGRLARHQLLQFGNVVGGEAEASARARA